MTHRPTINLNTCGSLQPRSDANDLLTSIKYVVLERLDFGLFRCSVDLQSGREIKENAQRTCAMTTFPANHVPSHLGSGLIPKVLIYKRYCTVLLSIAYTDTYRYRINTAYLNYPTPSYFLLLTTFSSSSYDDTLKYTLK